MQHPEHGSWTGDYQILENWRYHRPGTSTGWFQAYCLALILSLATGIIYSLLRRNPNKLKWAMKEHEQQVYLKKKSAFFININHELRTPLTLIHAPLKQLLQSLHFRRL